MRRGMTMRFGILLFILLVSCLAVGISFCLGQLYLSIIKEGTVPRSTKVNTDNSKSVAASDNRRVLFLDPIPVYYLQAGVYSDLQGAQQAAQFLKEMGYHPYVTQSAPYKIWIGVYQKRERTETIKQQLKDKGIGSFSGSAVINGSNLWYGEGNETFINQIAPVLRAYTAWLKENLKIFHADRVEDLQWSVVSSQITVIGKVYEEIQSFAVVRTNSDTINKRFENLMDTVEGYHAQLDNFQQLRNQENFRLLQYRLLNFVDNYLLLWQEIDNIDKT